MDDLTSTIAAAFVAFAARLDRSDGKACTDMRHLPCPPRVRGHRGDHRDAVTEDVRSLCDPALRALLY
jgi:hypothetical protein